MIRSDKNKLCSFDISYLILLEEVFFYMFPISTIV